MRSRVIAIVVAAIVAIVPGPSRAQGIGEAIFGAATGGIDEPGSLTPTASGRFLIQDRLYRAQSLGRSVDDELAACFTGRLESTEEWSLETPRMSGSQQATVRIRPERGTVTLRLRGQMDGLTASGTWEVVRATGQCDGLEAEGRYTATYSDRDPQFRLTFDGRGRQ